MTLLKLTPKIGHTILGFYETRCFGFMCYGLIDMVNLRKPLCSSYVNKIC